MIKVATPTSCRDNLDGKSFLFDSRYKSVESSSKKKKRYTHYLAGQRFSPIVFSLRSSGEKRIPCRGVSCCYIYGIRHNFKVLLLNCVATPICALVISNYSTLYKISRLLKELNAQLGHSNFQNDHIDLGRA